MLRKYPLTTLFVIATLCVDVAVVVALVRQPKLENSGWRFYLWNFFIPAQISTLALWSVFGKTHRLSRGAIITLAGSVLILAHGLVFQDHIRNESTSFNLFHALVIIVGAIFLKLFGVGRPREKLSSNFQFSLVEMFGWSMIVALWAFASRAALTNFPVDEYTFIWIIAAVLPPLLIAPVLFSNLSTTMRLVGLAGAYFIAFIIYWFADQRLPGLDIVLWSFGLAVTQIAYISAWWAIIRMDEAMQERQAISDASREKLKVFEPNQG